ncbi:hypothetical protein VTP01DRAFT_3263 [Rhizomucor pusillus]|uniref:uncharacterized protein n=1 Tax=Rhizomucor pusillus TaxID=4840 RepID=UPI0037422B0B
MDLSWCIICDNRIDGDVNDSELYCSETCKNKDATIPSQQQAQQQMLFELPARTRGATPNLKNLMLLRNKQQRPPAPSTSYPWIPLYRRRHGIQISRRQPSVCRKSTTVGNFVQNHGSQHGVAF